MSSGFGCFACSYYGHAGVSYYYKYPDLYLCTNCAACLAGRLKGFNLLPGRLLLRCDEVDYLPIESDTFLNACPVPGCEARRTTVCKCRKRESLCSAGHAWHCHPDEGIIAMLASRSYAGMVFPCEHCTSEERFGKKRIHPECGFTKQRFVKPAIFRGDALAVFGGRIGLLETDETDVGSASGFGRLIVGLDATHGGPYQVAALVRRTRGTGVRGPQLRWTFRSTDGRSARDAAKAIGGSGQGNAAGGVTKGDDIRAIVVLLGSEHPLDIHEPHTRDAEAPRPTKSARVDDAK